MIAFIDFHEARSTQERRWAEALAPGRIRDLHNEMADRHRDLAVSLKGPDASSEFADQQG